MSVLNPTNEELLALPDHLLGGRAKQRRFLLRIALSPMPCPVCNVKTDKVTAAGVALNDYDVTGKDTHEYHCPNCRATLTYVVPFMGPAYQWAHLSAADERTP